MRRSIGLLAIAAGLLFPLIASAPANAQATRTWVSGVGDDANPCSRTAPCKTFAGAISKTAPSGEINCLDPGGFGGLTITKAMTVSCEAGTAGVLVSGTPGITVSAGAADNVYLKGLDFEGLGTGTNGIKFNSGAGLIVDSCVIRGFGAVNAFGINFAPTNTATLTVVNSVIQHNGNSAGSGGGVQIAPVGAAVASALLSRVTVDRNIVGVSAVGVGAGSSLIVYESTIANNTSTGAAASGVGASVRLGSSSIVSNGGAATSGNVVSYNNNQIDNNNPNTIPATTPLH